MKKLFCLALVLLLSTIVMAGPKKEIFVKSKFAKMRKHPRNKKNAIKVRKGTQLKRLGYKKKWFRVKLEGRKGWIYRGRLTRKKPKRDPSLMAGGYDPDKAARLSANSAARGLDDLTEAMTKKHPLKEIHKKFADYHNSYVPIDKIPSNLKITTSKKIKMVKITEDEIQDFMDEARDNSGKEDESVNFEEDDEGW